MDNVLERLSKIEIAINNQTEKVMQTEAHAFQVVNTTNDKLRDEPEIPLSNIEPLHAEKDEVSTNDAVKVIENTFSSMEEKRSSEAWKGDLRLEDLRKMQLKFAKDRDWNQFHSPRNLLLALVGEVGEVSELFQWKGEVPCGLPEWTEKEKENLGDELSDVLLYLIRLSDVCAVDLEKAVIRKYSKNEAKYPVEKCRGSSKKYTEYT